ncbi:MAG TPA: hypothetical protein PK468_23570 [Candidatus Hydrogenedentes bacterium]|nr:hypothetical protein [Candidatus Hydrogenedentota bacterium]
MIPLLYQLSYAAIRFKSYQTRDPLVHCVIRTPALTSCATG